MRPPPARTSTGYGSDALADIDPATLAAGTEELENVTLPRYELDQLLGVATLYVDAFTPDEMMTLPGTLGLQDIEAILERYGRRY